MLRALLAKTHFCCLTDRLDYLLLPQIILTRLRILARLLIHLLAMNRAVYFSPVSLQSCFSIITNTDYWMTKHQMTPLDVLNFASLVSTSIFNRRVAARVLPCSRGKMSIKCMHANNFSIMQIFNDHLDCCVEKLYGQNWTLFFNASQFCDKCKTILDFSDLLPIFYNQEGRRTCLVREATPGFYFYRLRVSEHD